MGNTLIRFSALCAVWMILSAGHGTAAVPYCNITDVTYREMSNGVQITVKADGALEADELWEERAAQHIRIVFTNAKSRLGKSFIDVSRYPVSYLQLSVPQGAAEGVGIQMDIACYVESDYRARASADRTGYYVTVLSERTLERGAAPKEEAAEEAKDLRVEAEDGLVTVHCLKVDIHELLGEIAAKTGVNFALDDAVRHEVSLNLARLPVAAVIQGIASAYGLALTCEDGVYMLSEGVPTDLPSYRLSGTRSFPLRYTRASEASGLLPTFLYSYLHVNQPQNAVVVSAPNQMLDKIGEDLTKIDVAPPQILIEALAVEFASTRDLDQVVEARYGDVTGVGDLMDYYADERDDLLKGFMQPRSGEIRYSTLGQLPSDFEAQIRALETTGRARVHACPRMAAINGYKASIFIGLRRFIRVEYLSGGLTQEQIQGVDVGVKLAVTPWTGGDGEITVQVEPEVSNVAEVDLQTGLPVLSTRSAATKVRVKDGETILIGGLTQKLTFDTVSKIPILGDLPLIGGLFRSRKGSQTESELVVFVTPHILTEEGRLADEEQERQIREKFLPE